jgi:hypothetical protein
LCLYAGGGGSVGAKVTCSTQDRQKIESFILDVTKTHASSLNVCWIIESYVYNFGQFYLSKYTNPHEIDASQQEPNSIIYSVNP